MDREAVLSLARSRAEKHAAQRALAERRASRTAERRRTAGPPDTEHEWLTVPEATAFLGVSEVAVNKRCRRDRLPHVEDGGRRWLRRDLLELDQRARRAEAAGVVPYGYALHDASAEQRLAAFSLIATMGSTADLNKGSVASQGPDRSAHAEIRTTMPMRERHSLTAEGHRVAAAGP